MGLTCWWVAVVVLSLTSFARGTDDDVQQVQSPYVDSRILGPSMEHFTPSKASQHPSQRELRDANFPSYSSGCLSCKAGGISSSSYGYTSGSQGSLPGIRRPNYYGPVQTSSSKQEVRTEQRYVDGQPVYDLHHERHFEDGQLIHEKKSEKDEDDFGVPNRSGTYSSNSGRYDQFGQGDNALSGYDRHLEETHLQGSSFQPSQVRNDGSQSAYNYNSGYEYSGYHSDGMSNDFNSEVARLREQLHRQMTSYRPGSLLPTTGGSHRTETHSQTRYINGKPVYVKNEEKRYENGQLIHNRTEEKGPEDLGTESVAQQYDSNGALIGGAVGGDSYRYRQEQHETSGRGYGSSRYPSTNYGGRYGTYNSPVHGGSTYHRQQWHETSSSSLPSYRPTSGSSSVTYNQDSRQSSSSYPSYRPTSGSSSTTYNQETYSGSSSYPSNRPISGSSSVTYNQDSRQSSSSYPSNKPISGSYSTTYNQGTHRSSPSYPSNRPISGSSSVPYNQDSRESSSSYPSNRPISGSYSTTYNQETHRSSPSYPSNRPISGSSSVTYNQESRESSSSYPSYRPTSGNSSNIYNQETHRSSSSYPSNRPISGSYSTTYNQETHRGSSSYPSNRPASGSSSVTYNQESRESSSSYPSYRPTSGNSSTIYNQETHRSSSSYPSNRPVSGSSSVTYNEETHGRSSSYPSYRPVSGSSPYPSSRPSSSHHYQYESSNTSSSSSSSAYPTHSQERQQHEVDVDDEEEYDDDLPADELEATHVLQSVQQPDLEDFPFYTGNRQQGENNQESSSSHGSRGGARTVVFDLSSQSSSDTTLTDQLLGSNARHYGGEERSRHHDIEEVDNSLYESHTSRREQSYGHQQPGQVGIPGVISGPQIGIVDDDHLNKERYDISPLDDGYTPELPEVDNEVDSSLIPTLLPVDNEVDSDYLSGIDSTESPYSHQDENYNIHLSHIDTNQNINVRPNGIPGQEQLGSGSGFSQSSYYYNKTHTAQGTLINHPGHVVGQDQYDSTYRSESGNLYPGAIGSGQHYYGESWSHSRGTETQPIVGSSSSSYSSSSSSSSTGCGQVSGGCIPVGTPESSSTRSETRTTSRYVNGKLVGVTQHERRFENGVLVHENQTEHAADELNTHDLNNFGIDHFDLQQNGYQPGSYSQRHEVRQEKKYVNGQQVYDLHHERRFEDGNLVYNNRTEKDEDDLGVSRVTLPGQLGSGYTTSSRAGGDGWHEVTQSQHLQQQATSHTSGGTVGISSQTHQGSDTTQVLNKPVYSTRRYESRRQQESINGQPVYDLQHERRYQDGSLVYENRTELDEKDLGYSQNGGHVDALHQIMAGNTLRTASESRASSYGGQGPLVSGSQGSVGSYDSRSYESSHSVTRDGSGSSSSVSGGQGVGSALLGGSRSTTTVIGSGGAQHDGIGSSLLRGGGGSGSSTTVIGSGSGGAVTTLLGAGGVSSYDSESSSSSSSYGSSSHQGSQESSGGCLSCILVGGGSGYSSSFSSSQGSSSQQGSHGYSGSGALGVDGAAGGYSHRQENSFEEHYDNGQLVYGREDERKFRDGQLVQENRRQYSDIPGQVSNTAALRSPGTSYASSASSSSAASSSSSSAASSSSSSSSAHSSSSRSDPMLEGVCVFNPCRNGGTCIAGLRGALCACPFGFKGKECHEVYCPKRFCRHGGSCSIQDGVHVCQCQSGYSGPRCQKRSRRNARHHSRNA